MKLVEKYTWSSRSYIEYDIATAMEITCRSHADGITERAQDTAVKVSEKLGRLVELLHDKGLLQDDDVLSLLSGFEKAS